MKEIVNKEAGFLITSVKPGSPAAKAGVRKGWRLLRIDNHPVGDILDYRILTADEKIKALFNTGSGYLRRTTLILKDGESPGLEFESPTLAPLQRCGNRCIFCFVAQNPPGLRQTLYVKDDDYRLSFLYGNFITLNRVTEDELQRIIKLQLSPIYVSVHTTNPELRERMFGSRHGKRGLDNLYKLIAAGIAVHAQIVLCPGYNSGPEMLKTIKDLANLGPNLLSLGLVPVGLTKHRDGLEELKGYDPESAKELLRELKPLQQEFLETRGTRFVFAADEFYNLAAVDYPPEDFYEGYPQLENGIGLGRIFLNELDLVKNELPLSLNNNLKITIATGKSAGRLLNTFVEMLSGIDKLVISLEIVENHFFGNSVTVAGLLTGSDLIRGLDGKVAGQILFISTAMLKDRSNLFLDNTTVSELEDKLQVKVFATFSPLAVLNRIKELDIETEDNKAGEDYE